MSSETVPPTEPLDRFAFYYPGWIWRDAAWLKNLVLFFDGVALLVPEYMRDRPPVLPRRGAYGTYPGTR